MQNLIERRRRQGLDIGKARHETLVVGNDGPDLCLLQHDFRYPHAIRAGVRLPRQIVTSMRRKPGEQAFAELRLPTHLPNNPCSPFFLSISCNFCLSWVLAASRLVLTAGSVYVPVTVNGISIRVVVGAFRILAVN